MHPMVPTDLDDVVYDMAAMNESLTTGAPVVMASVFMGCSAPMLAQSLARKRAYKGYVTTDKGTYEIGARLKRCTKYIDAIEGLYRAFQNNNVEWGTVNCPYAYKFVDVVLDTALQLENREKIKEITVDLAEYEAYKVPNAVPLWNVTTMPARDAEFPAPMPAVDRILYEHKIALEALGAQNGYMVALGNNDYIYQRRTEDALIIASAVNNQAAWELLQISHISNLKQKQYPYETVSNKRDMGFAGKFSGVKSLVIRTRGEIARLLQSYDTGRQLAFRHVEILDRYNKPPQTFDFNTFVDDNIRVDPYKKVMLVAFESGGDDKLIYDKMSFLVSELQILFPEYKCVGELT
jgi:hypothetical protein